MNAGYHHLRNAYTSLLEADLAYAAGSKEAQASYAAASKVAALMRAEIDSVLASPADVFARRAQLDAAIELDGPESFLAARAARHLAKSTRRAAKSEARRLAEGEAA